MCTLERKREREYIVDDVAKKMRSIGKCYEAEEASVCPREEDGFCVSFRKGKGKPERGDGFQNWEME